jgi:hypothetical protein
MKNTPLLLLIALAFIPAVAHGQSACAQLGVDCSHPNVEQRPQETCGYNCRQQEQRDNDAYWERREAYDREREAEKQRERERKAQEKAIKEENKRIHQANKISADAWAAMQKDDCATAVSLYDKALALTDFIQWQENRAICMRTLRDFDAAYASWERIVKDPKTPEEEIPSIRAEEWWNMYDKGYTCPLPPFFNGIVGCHRRADRVVKTLDSTYVPLPYIEGKYWTPLAIVSSGPYHITTTDGRTYDCPNGSTNCTTLNLLNARITTDSHTAVRFLLPDETVFTLGPDSDMKLDDFVYDPNTNMSTAALNMTKGVFRFVTGKIANHDPAGKKLKLAIGDLGFRGTDVEVSVDDDRMWVYAYEGDISFTDGNGVVHPIPINQYLTIFDGVAVWLRPIDQNDNGGKPGLNVTDPWDDKLGNLIKREGRE